MTFIMDFTSEELKLIFTALDLAIEEYEFGYLGQMQDMQIKMRSLSERIMSYISSEDCV